ncbi:MAG: hypothetical protein IJI39_03140 [Clostridia bacterium]|nr:hypothetical protein [Clostridia bacterium]
MKRIVSLLLMAVICLSQVITLAADNETTLKNVTLYNWDFSAESQTTDNVLTLTNAEYVSDNQNIRLNAKTGAASVSVNLETSLTADTADNIINIEFDMNFGKISGQTFRYSILSGTGSAIECSFSPYSLSSTGSINIGTSAATSEGAAFNECVTAYNGDGMSASATHFRNEINLEEGTATVYITGSSKTGIFTGSFDRETYTGISGMSVSMSKMDTSRFSYIDNIKFSQLQVIERPPLDELVQYVTADAEGDTTTVDTSKMVYGEHIEKFLVTTAKDGVLIKQYETEATDSVTVDTTGAENIEISPIYSYTELTDIAFNTAEGVTLDNINALGEIADGRYDFTIKRANGTNVTDIYINDGMVVNNSEQSGVGRSTPKGFEYIINDVSITGGSINVKTLRTEQGSKSAGYANAVTYPTAPISYITIKKCPDVIDRKTKITILGDSLVANYYAGKSTPYLGYSRTGWGQVLSEFVDMEKYEIINLANSGHYAKILYDTAMDGAINNSMSGDIILCQCGYNDRVRSNETEMAEYMTKMYNEATAAGITMIFVAPPATCDDETKYSTSSYPNPIDTTAADYKNTSYTYPVRYGMTVKSTAESLGAGFVDLSRMSYDYMTMLYGTDDIHKAKTFYRWGLGLNDYIHLSYTGAMKWASFVAQDLYNQGFIISLNTDNVFTQTDEEGNKIICSVSETPKTIFNDYTISATDDKIEVRVKANTNGNVYAAMYDNNGVLSEVKKAANSNKVQLLSFDRPLGGGKKIKVFNWSDNMKPILNPDDEYVLETVKADTLPETINETVDLAVFAGQSNMAGRGSASEATACNVNAGFEFRAISDPHSLYAIAEPFGLNEDWVGGICDRNSDGTSKRGTKPENYTGSMVSSVVDEYYKQTGRQLVAVSAAVGGTTTDEWKEMYISDAVNRLDKAKAYLERNGVTVGRIFVVWCQGESDADNKVTAEVYTQNTKDLFAEFKAHGVEKCFMVQIGHYNYNRSGASQTMDANYGIIRDAQTALCESDNDFVLAATFEPYINDMKDLYHYNQPAYNAVGKTAADIIADFYNE